MMTTDRERFLTEIQKYPEPIIPKKDVVAIATQLGIGYPTFFINDPANKAGRGKYRVPTTSPAMAKPAPVVPIHSTPTVTSTDSLIPEQVRNFVPFGHFADIKTIIASQQFYPVFITGHSGNGKTLAIEQACAQLKRKFVIVSMTPETDEGDLLGNFVLIDNTMVWKDGPVTRAAKEGAVLCLDEIDYGAANLTTLQRVLEGKPFLLKKKNEVVSPAPGFTIFATANTKGRGSDDGRYMYTNVLNEAFLERFPITLEQDWAPKAVEKKILSKEFTLLGMDDEPFVTMLIDWAQIIRKTFTDGGCQDVISTRRLVHIARAYAIFKDRIKALESCLNRFDHETKTSFLDLYTKLDVTVAPVANTVAPETTNAEPAKDTIVNSPPSGGTATNVSTPLNPTTIGINSVGTGTIGSNFKTYTYIPDPDEMWPASGSNKQAYLDAVKRMLENNADQDQINDIINEWSKLNS